MEMEDAEAELTVRDQLNLWASEVELLHEDIRTLEQNIIRAVGLLMSSLILAVGLVVSLRANDPSPAHISRTLLPFLCILLSLVGSTFLIVGSYLGFGIIRADIYIRHLNRVSQDKLGILISGWENWKHRRQGDLPTSLERKFYRLGHGLFVLFICFVSLAVAVTGLLSFFLAGKNLRSQSLVSIAWSGFSFALLAFLFSVLFFSLTCSITLFRVYRGQQSK